MKDEDEDVGAGMVEQKRVQLDPEELLREAEENAGNTQVAAASIIAARVLYMMSMYRCRHAHHLHARLLQRTCNAEAAHALLQIT